MTQDTASLTALFGVGIVSDCSGLLIARELDQIVPRHPCILWIQSMNQICRIVEGHHGNTLLVIQIPYEVLVFIIQQSLGPSVSLKPALRVRSEVIADLAHFIEKQKFIQQHLRIV